MVVRAAPAELGVPLDAQEEGFFGCPDSLDGVVGGTRRDAQVGTDFADGLVMDAVDREGIALAYALEQRAGLQIDGVGGHVERF